MMDRKRLQRLLDLKERKKKVAQAHAARAKQATDQERKQIARSMALMEGTQSTLTQSTRIDANDAQFMWEQVDREKEIQRHHGQQVRTLLEHEENARKALQKSHIEVKIVETAKRKATMAKRLDLQRSEQRQMDDRSHRKDLP